MTTAPAPHPTPEERVEAALKEWRKDAGDLRVHFARAIREAEAAGEARGRAIAIVAVEQVAASQGRTECCGCGISLGGPPECCNDPLYMISDRDAIAAIRARTDKENSDG